MSTENICNTAKNNKLRNQETFAIFMLTGLIICLLLVCPTLPRPSDCWEPSHLHPTRTRAHTLAAAAPVLTAQPLSPSAEAQRQEDVLSAKLSPAGQAALGPSPQPGLPADPSAASAPASHGKADAGGENSMFPTCRGGMEITKPWCLPGKLLPCFGSPR